MIRPLALILGFIGLCAVIARRIVVLAGIHPAWGIVIFGTVTAWLFLIGIFLSVWLEDRKGGGNG